VGALAYDAQRIVAGLNERARVLKWARRNTRWSQLSTLWPRSSPTVVSCSTVRPSPRQKETASTGVPASSSMQAAYSSRRMGGS